jgi:hypothetical protein
LVTTLPKAGQEASDTAEFAAALEDPADAPDLFLLDAEILALVHVAEQHHNGKIYVGQIGCRLHIAEGCVFGTVRASCHTQPQQQANQRGQVYRNALYANDKSSRSFSATRRLGLPMTLTVHKGPSHDVATFSAGVPSSS